jgi:hypothetical protein
MREETVEKYKGFYKDMHEEGMFKGGSLKAEYIGSIKMLVKATKSTTVIDFGCGKAAAYKKDPPINDQFGIKSSNMYFYDIGVPEYEILPDGPFDGVICTDVLEHIPEELIDDALEKIFTRAQKFVFLIIHCGKAVKSLPNGENAHVTIRHPDWWNEKLSPYYDSSRLVHVRYVIPPDPKLNILKL